MKYNRILLTAATAALLILTTPAWGDDLLITGNINGAQTYASSEGIVIDNAVFNANADVIVTSTYDVVLKPGTTAKTGASLVIGLKDDDGLPNSWEIEYFGNLAQHPDADFDKDGLTNFQEYQLSSDPTIAGNDNDTDGLPDTWELQYGTLADIDGRNGHADNDGISNWIEYKLGTDPTKDNDRGPGIYYEYDELGRIRKIERIPSQ